MTEHIDFLETPLPTILLAQQEQLEKAEATIHRYAEGLNAFLWEMERLPAPNSAFLTPKMAQEMLDAVGVYAETGRRCDAIERALEELS